MTAVATRSRRNVVPDIIICSILLGALSTMYLLSGVLRLLLDFPDPSTSSNDPNHDADHIGASPSASSLTLAQLIDRHSIEYGWLLKLLVNCYGYACVIVPGFLIYQYTKRINYLKEGRSIGLLADLVRFCFKSHADTTVASTDAATSGSAKSSTIAIGASPTAGGGMAAAAQQQRSTSNQCLLYAYCFVGLNVSYLSWGLLQEKIVTQEYHDPVTGRAVHFRDSQFLVFVNRSLAFVVAGVWLRLTAASSSSSSQRHRAPLFKYSYASLSNIMSAWFQYEALKFVSFPTQVLAKSCKIIPVMLMGKIVSRSTRYEFYEYLTAGLISLGMVCFLLGSADGAAHRTSITTMAGVLLLTLYLVSDSFTANWQGDLFRVHQMTPVQMMCGVSGFSALFTAASLALQGGFGDSVHFAAVHPKFLVDCMVLSASSAVGQLFIFYTISKFGAVGFTIIMTIRQSIAILLSCIVYDHYISAFGIVGIVVVFVAIFIRVYCSQRMKNIRKKADAARGQRFGV